MTLTTSSSTSWPTQNGAAPLFATPRNPDAPNEGLAVAAVARTLGTPFIPWQQYTVDVATEKRPDGSYEYEIVIVCVPRQTGKTTLIYALGIYRCHVCGVDVYYAAQTGKDGRKRWKKFYELLRKTTVWARRHWLLRSQGSEAILFHHREGPGFYIFAPVDDCIHGDTNALVILDEAFAHDKAKGELLMGAIEPAQQNVKAKQLWIVSTMGTEESVFLHEWIKKGMAGTDRVACFLWGAADDEAPFSLEGITAYHPGVGFQLNEVVLTAESILAKAPRMPRSEYVRAFGNRKTLTKDNLIPADVWIDLKDEQLAPPPDTRELTLTYDVATDRRASAIVATWNLPDGRVAGKVVQSSEGTRWLAPAVDGLVKAWRPAELAAPGHGPVLDVTAQLRDLGHDPTEVTGAEFGAASSVILGRIKDKDLVHDGGPVLAASVVGLAGRPDNHGGLSLSRRLSVGDPSAGFALAVGIWVTERRAQNRKPVMRFA